MPSFGKENALRIVWIAVLTLLSASVLVSCGGGSSDVEPATGQDDPQGPSHDGGDGGGEPPVSQTDMPDPNSQPVEFLEWRVDQIFAKDDLDGDGQLTMDEWSGPEHNFERLDANEDGLLSKQEIIADQTEGLRERGEIP